MVRSWFIMFRIQTEMLTVCQYKKEMHVRMCVKRVKERESFQEAERPEGPLLTVTKLWSHHHHQHNVALWPAPVAQPARVFLRDDSHRFMRTTGIWLVTQKLQIYTHSFCNCHGNLSIVYSANSLPSQYAVAPFKRLHFFQSPTGQLARWPECLGQFDHEIIEKGEPRGTALVLLDDMGSVVST